MYVGQKKICSEKNSTLAMIVFLVTYYFEVICSQIIHNIQIYFYVGHYKHKIIFHRHSHLS